MQTTSALSMVALGLATLLAGCLADTVDTGFIDEDAADEGIVEERVEQAEGALGACSGESCNGQDPGAMGCEADAYTRASASIMSGSTVVGTVAIRHSPGCNATWTRTSTSSGSFFLRSQVARASPYFAGHAASPVATTALRSPMVGVVAGTTFTGVGRIGTAYNFYQYTGSVSTSF